MIQSRKPTAQATPLSVIRLRAERRSQIRTAIVAGSCAAGSLYVTAVAVLGLLLQH